MLLLLLLSLESDVFLKVSPLLRKKRKTSENDKLHTFNENKHLEIENSNDYILDFGTCLNWEGSREKISFSESTF